MNWRRERRIWQAQRIGGCLAVPLLIAAGAFVAWQIVTSLPGFGRCSNELLAQAASSSGDRAGVVLTKCADPRHDVTSVVLSAKDHDATGTYVFVIGGRAGVSARWTGPTELLVSCAKCPVHEIAKQLPRWHAVHITYTFAAVP